MQQVHGRYCAEISEVPSPTQMLRWGTLPAGQKPNTSVLAPLYVADLTVTHYGVPQDTPAQALTKLACEVSKS